MAVKLLLKIRWSIIYQLSHYCLLCYTIRYDSINITIKSGIFVHRGYLWTTRGWSSLFFWITFFCNGLDGLANDVTNLNIWNKLSIKIHILHINLTPLNNHIYFTIIHHREFEAIRDQFWFHHLLDRVD